MANPIATAADYADALGSARTAKKVLFLLLLLVLLLQLGIFLGAYFSDAFELRGPRPMAQTTSGPEIAPDGEVAQLAQATLPADTATATPEPVAAPPEEMPELAPGVVEIPEPIDTAPDVDAQDIEATEAPSTEAPSAKAPPTVPAAAEGRDATPHNIAMYVIGLSVFVGMGLAIILSLDILLILKIMLIGRLIGVARMTTAYLWSLVLIALLCPWQAMFPFNFRIPGVLYTWEELAYDIAHFPTGFSEMAVLKWTRYVVFPVIALIVLFIVQGKSNRGLNQALGIGSEEDDVPVA